MIQGRFYDGKTSKRIDAALNLDPQGRSCTVARPGAADPILRQDAGNIKISPRIGQTARYIYFAGGEKFETTDNEGVDRLVEHLDKGRWIDKVHFIENRMGYVLAALAVLMGLMWAGVRYGVPYTANLIARHLPAGTLEFAGDQTLAVMDKSVFAPSALDPDRQKDLLTHFKPVLDRHKRMDVQVIFRKGGPIGPNAFALPSAQVVFTDEMVAMAQNDDELSAVLLHEMGHIVHRHGLRTVIQDSILGFVLLAFTGDVSGSSELFMGLPVFFTQMAYSRGFEREADQYALAGMKQMDIPLSRFADLMDRLGHMQDQEQQQEQQQGQKTASQQEKTRKKWTSYLSTHPEMEERLKPFRNP